MTQQTGVDSWVYFIREIRTDGTSGRIKIGKAKDPWERRDTFQTANANPLRIEHIEPGSYDREAYFHRRFKRHRRRGEWFEPAKEIEKYLADAPDYLPAPSPFSLPSFGWLAIIPRGAWRILLALVLTVFGSRRRKREVRPLAMLGLAAPAAGAGLTIADITDPNVAVWIIAAVLLAACTIAGATRTR